MLKWLYIETSFHTFSSWFASVFQPNKKTKKQQQQKREKQETDSFIF